jgi:glycosyltransferase involved in cell wall biosynthesis
VAPVLSVIIGTYNQADIIGLCLQSLCNQTLAPELYEIIVVDSLSKDNTSDIVIQHNANDNIKYIRQENRGKTAARNTGIKAAKGEIIVLTDADMIADNNFLEEHLSFHNLFKMSCAEGLTYNLKSLKPDFGPTNIEPYIKQKIKPGQNLKWAYFLSGNLSLPKNMLIKAGLFDERFVGYGWEDIELGYRLSKMGIPLIYLPQAVNYHYHLPNKEELVKRKYTMGLSAALFYLKHPDRNIKLFLGINPLATFIYRLIKKTPRLQKRIFDRAVKSSFCRYLAEEFNYRFGMEEKFREEGIKL